MSQPSSAAKAPVEAAIARGFLNALQDEYVRGVQNAVGDYYDRNRVPGSAQQTLDAFEEDCRRSSNRANFIKDLENKWNLNAPAPAPTAPQSTAASAPLESKLQVSNSTATPEELLKEISSALSLPAGNSTQSVILAGLQAEDTEVVRKALCAGPRLGLATALLAQITAAEQRLRVALNLPADWDMGTFACGRYLQGGLGGRQDSCIVAFQPQPKPVVDALQYIFDGTYRKVYTRDRRGAPIPDGFRIKGVYRVFNDQVWREYLKQRDSVRAALGGQVDPVPDGALTAKKIQDLSPAARVLPLLDASVNETWLFHGTSAEAASGIAENDFRLDLSGSNAGTLYGKGIYLAENVTKSDEYGEGPRGPSGEQEEAGYEGPRPPPGPPPPLIRDSYILVCRSTLGKVRYNDEKRPDADDLQQSCLKGPYHSVIGDRLKLHGTFREIIVYSDDLVYPEFIVHYERIFFHERFAEIYKGMCLRKRQGHFNGATAQEKDVLQSMWNVFGMPNRGRINKWQLLDLLTAIGQPPMNEEEDLDQTFKEWDTKKDGWIDWDEFLQEMVQRVNDGREYY